MATAADMDRLLGACHRLAAGHGGKTMSTTTDAGGRGRQLPERLTWRLLEALIDPARRERTAAMAILAYVAVWTLYGVLAKASQDIHADMSEQFTLARDLAWGYAKHPPLAMAVVRLWFSLFPAADWAYYLLGIATVGLTLWIVWRLSARFLDAEKRVVGLALMTLVPFFNFHALKFNSNTVLLPVWAATTLWFLRSFESRRVLDAALAGLLAALSMYGKYWSIFLLLGLGMAALADGRRAAYFRSPAPWVTIAVGATAMAPHVAWLLANDFVPFSYAIEVHAASSLGSTLRGVWSYLAGSLAFVAAPLILVVVLARPDRRTVLDMAWPAEPQRRLAALAFWGGLLLPAAVAPLTSVHLVSIWSMSAWTLLPVVLLSSPRITITRRAAARVLALAIVFPFVMLALAPAIAFSVHRSDPFPGVAHGSVLAEPVERIWQETTDRPLRLIAGYDELTDGIAFYMRGRPIASQVLHNIDTHAADHLIDRHGIVLVCPGRARHPPAVEWCVRAVERIAGRFPEGLRREIEIRRRYLGFEGRPMRYLILTIPPPR
jgi:hypothetical protein